MSELYQLPDGWEWKKLGNVINILGGGTPSKANKEFYENGTIKWATVRDMNTDLIVDTELKITYEAIKESSTSIIPVDAIIIATRVGLGKVCYLQTETAINQDLKGLIPNKALLIKEYLFYFFKSISDYIIENGSGSTVKGVKLEFINSLNIPLPPVTAQKRIVQKLDALFVRIDKAIAILQKNIAAADNFMNSVLNDVFSDLENNYHKIKFEHVCEKITDGSHNPPKGIENSGFLMLSSKNIFNNLINFENPRYLTEIDFIHENKRTNVSKGNVLLTIVGTIGRTAVVNTDEKFVLQRSVAVIKPMRELLDPFFLMYSLQKNLQVLLSQANGAAQQGIYLKSIKQLEIVNVPLLVQEKIVVHLDSLSEKIDQVKSAQQQKMQNLLSLKSSILDQAFHGKL